ncbi:MAG: ABC transporter ATP-binding protein [Anaerolineaceae bacterium]|nr:ABC transporter ATP-binding protein [Anaerolineaceae bacterium]
MPQKHIERSTTYKVPTMLNVRNLSYSYGPHHVLQDVSFALYPGEIAMLVGRNGAGKSTLLRCLAGWSKPGAGTITVNEIELHQAQSAKDPKVIFVPDVPDFYDELTVWEHLELIGNLYHMADWEDEAIRLLDVFELEDIETAFPFSLSRGMRQKLAIIMALMVSPQVIFLDEPFGPLDINAIETVWQELESLQQQGAYILMSSHMLPEGKHADRHLLLQHQQTQFVDAAHFNNMSSLLNYEEPDYEEPDTETPLADPSSDDPSLVDEVASDE